MLFNRFLQGVVPILRDESVETEDFKITLEDVKIILHTRASIFLDWDISLDGFHNFFDMRSLMAAILEASSGYQQLADIELLIKAGIVEWLSSQQVTDWWIW